MLSHFFCGVVGALTYALVHWLLKKLGLWDIELRYRRTEGRKVIKRKESVMAKKNVPKQWCPNCGGELKKGYDHLEETIEIGGHRTFDFRCERKA